MSETDFDLDRALMDYLREDCRNGSRMVPIDDIVQGLIAKHGRAVTPEEIVATALRTRYTQRAADGSVTRIPPYHYGHRQDQNLTHSLQLTVDAYEHGASYGIPQR